MTTSARHGQDSFDAERDAWIGAIPGPVNAASEAVRQRIGRIARQYDRVLADVAAEHGLSVGDLEALSTLARSDPDGVGLAPGRMGTLLGLTSGTIAVRVDRLVRAGLAEHVRPTGGGDARRRPVRLTAAGARAWGAATVRRTALESQLMGDVFGAAEVELLGALLGRLLARLEAQYGPAPRHDMTRGRRTRQ